MAQLNELTKKYLDRNGIKYSFFADYIGCKTLSRLSKWMNNGSGKLTKEELQRTHDFISGKYLVTLEEIVGGDMEDEDSTIQ